MNRGKEIVRLVGMVANLATTIGFVYLYSLTAREAVKCYYGSVWGMRLVLCAACEAFLHYSLYLFILPVTVLCCSVVAIRYRRVIAQECIIQCGWWITVSLLLWALWSWMFAFVPPHPAVAIYTYK